MRVEGGGCGCGGRFQDLNSPCSWLGFRDERQIGEQGDQVNF